jgi:hypothetical protein
MLAIFAGCAALMSARLVPALLAVPLMALAMAAVAGAGSADLARVVVDGTVKLAPVFVTVIFGAWLSRVTIATGIAETIVSYAAEFGGDSPAVLALVLAAAVALLFTSLTGLGAIIMVGSIVLPIMMTIGIPRRTAATLFMLAFALGFIFNIAQWKFYTTTFGVERAQMQPYAVVLAAIDLLALLAFTFLRFRSARGYAQWALEADEPRARAPLYALVAPLLPIALYFWLGLNPVIAFALAALYGAAAAKPREFVPTLVAAAIRGVEDVAPAVVLFMGIGMLLVATGLPAVKAALAPVVTAIAPRNALAYVVLFGILSPLALYRGPLNPFGVGIGVYTVLAGLGILPPATLVAAVMAVVQVQNVCDPTNTQNVWVANFTGVRVDEITRFTLPFQVGVATLATLVVAAFGAQLVGAQPFAPAAASAAQSAAPAGLFAPDAAAQTIAVAPVGGLSRSAARSVFGVLAQRWGGYRALWLDVSPPRSDCSRKPYAALIAVHVTTYDGGGAPPWLDTELQLEDCAGWPVDQWHVTERASSSGDGSALAHDGLAALERMQGWTIEHPALARALFGRGLAYLPSSGPTYFYTLFKAIDGTMRADVRPGGPAYAAGLRTDDVIEKVDGKDWWEYGTFATQRMAYDGLPHVFVVARAKRELTIALGAPYR